MKCLKVISASFFLVCLFGQVSFTNASCALEAKDNLLMDCAYKKSRLFRVRNLGGVKAHFSIGLGVGDDFGFRKLLEELGGYDRRSLNVGRSIESRPKLPPGEIQRNRVPTVNSQVSRLYTPNRMSMTYTNPFPHEVPAFKPLRPGRAITPITQAPYNAVNRFNQNDFEIQKSISFEIDVNAPTKLYPIEQISQPVNQDGKSITNPNILTPTNSNTMTIVPKPNPFLPFQAMPTSISKLPPNVTRFNDEKLTIQRFKPDPIQFAPSIKLPVIDLMGHTIEELAAAANVSVGMIQHAIKLRQQELIKQQRSDAYRKLLTKEAIMSTTTTTSSTTTKKPKIQRKVAGRSKVMNAPKEYYPAKYEKNFDDNFMSKVDLPRTSFRCGNQKHFPGLYADQDLGCMVFHVCAITDEGLIMKSFLCPEHTIFDQTILKCNWWYFVDCRVSKDLYVSNIPVSKSYQLMKALTFFSNYKTQGDDKNAGAKQTVKNSVDHRSK